MKKIIDLKTLVKFYKKGYFPMAENEESENIKFYKPNLRFIIPILNFHCPKKLFVFCKGKKIANGITNTVAEKKLFGFLILSL